MPCYHPLRGFKDPFHKHESGADMYRICGQRTESFEFKRFQEDRSTGVFLSENDYQRVTRFSEFGCGYCIGCQLDHAQKWAARLIAEAQTSSSAYFLTLTYDDAHLPLAPITDLNTGEVKDYKGTLCKADFQSFIKRLRESQRYLGHENIRFFVGGEYGPKTFRPHYHSIIYNMQLPFELGSKAAPVHKYNFAGDPIYRCDYISDLWKNGFITIAPVNDKTCGYVVRYTLKKLYRNPISLQRRISIYKRYLKDEVLPELEHDEERLDELLKSTLVRDLQFMNDFHGLLSKNARRFGVEHDSYIATTMGFILSMYPDEKLKIYEYNELRLYREKEEFNDRYIYGDFAYLEPEFQQSSLSPGLGHDFFMDHMSDILDSGELWINHKKYPIPRYFNKLAQLHMPDEYAVYQKRRTDYAQALQDKWFAEHPNVDRLQYLKQQEVLHEQRIKVLKKRSNII